MKLDILNKISELFLRHYLKNGEKPWLKSLKLEKAQEKSKKDVNSSAVAISLICAFEGVRGMRKVYDSDAIFNEFLESMGSFIKNLGI